MFHRHDMTREKDKPFRIWVRYLEHGWPTKVQAASFHEVRTELSYGDKVIKKAFQEVLWIPKLDSPILELFTVEYMNHQYISLHQEHYISCSQKFLRSFIVICHR